MLVANMATFPARTHALPGTVRRLAPQVDRLNLVLNEFDGVPGWISEFDNVVATIPRRDYKDIGKFVPPVAADDTVLLVDDDLFYPEDYAAVMAERLAMADPEQSGAIGGLHGTVYASPWQERSLRVVARVLYHRAWRVGSFRRLWNYWERLDRATIVEQIGTGTAVLPGRSMPPLEAVQHDLRRADVALARWAQSRQIPMVALPRAAGWLTGLDEEETIYSSYTRRMPRQLSDEIAAYAGKVPGAGRPWRNCGTSDALS